MTTRTTGCALLGATHFGLLEGVRGLLEGTFDGIFAVADRVSLVEGARRLQPQIVVLDLSLAHGDFPGLLQLIREAAPAGRTLLLCSYDEPTVAIGAFAAGADGIVLKRSIATDLQPAVETLLGGRRYVSPVATYGQASGTVPRP